MKSKNKVLGIFNGIFMSSYVGRAIVFLIFLNGDVWKKIGKPWSSVSLKLWLFTTHAPAAYGPKKGHMTQFGKTWYK